MMRLWYGCSIAFLSIDHFNRLLKFMTKEKNVFESIKDNFSIKDVLEFLAIGGVLVAAVAAPNAVQSFRFLMKNKNYVSWKKFNQTRARIYVDRLQKQGAIKRQRRGNQVKFTLTANGIKMIRKYNISNMKLKKERKWDRKWRIVIFDIPEKKKTARDALRQKFQSLGMLQLQKSVFVYPFDCRKEIDLVSDFFDVGQDILYLEADISDIKKELMEYFKLS